MKLALAVPTSGLPSLLTSLLSQVPWANAAPKFRNRTKAARKIGFIIPFSPSFVILGGALFTSAAQSCAKAFFSPDRRHPHISRRDGDASACLLASHHGLHQPSDDGQDCASGTAADNLTYDRPEIEAAAGGRACDRRNECLNRPQGADLFPGSVSYIAASRFCYVNAVEKVGSEIVRGLPTADIPGSLTKEGCWRPRSRSNRSPIT